VLYENGKVEGLQDLLHTQLADARSAARVVKSVDHVPP
jgi:hypothetical protein